MAGDSTDTQQPRLQRRETPLEYMKGMRHENKTDLFNTLDINHDGKLTRQEIISGVRKLGLPTTPEYVDIMLKQFDANGDKLLDFEEFNLLIQQREEELRNVFQELDADGSGAIDVRELKTALVALGHTASEKELDAMVSKVDKDHNGEISYPEFRWFFFATPHASAEAVFDFWESQKFIDSGDNAPLPQIAAKKESAWWKYLVAGGVAGSLSRTLTAPLDRIKVLMQIQTKQGPDTKQSKGGLAMVYRQVRSEGKGLLGFWRGNGVNVVKVAPESAMKFAVYERIKQLACKNPSKPTPSERCASGALAGMVAQTTIYPLETIKTRLMTTPPGTYKGIADAAKRIATQEGFFVLFRGWGTAMLGVAPYAGTELMMYETLKVWVVGRMERNGQQPGVVVMLGCGTVASAAAATMSYPLALIRTRLQAQGAGGRPMIYSGMIDAFRKTVSQEGFTALYRGLAPNLFKAIPACSISYVAYEKCKVFLSI